MSLCIGYFLARYTGELPPPGPGQVVVRVATTICYQVAPSLASAEGEAYLIAIQRYPQPEWAEHTVNLCEVPAEIIRAAAAELGEGL